VLTPQHYLEYTIKIANFQGGNLCVQLELTPSPRSSDSNRAKCSESYANSEFYQMTLNTHNTTSNNYYEYYQNHCRNLSVHGMDWL